MLKTDKYISSHISTIIRKVLEVEGTYEYHTDTGIYHSQFSKRVPLDVPVLVELRQNRYNQTTYFLSAKEQ